MNLYMVLYDGIFQGHIVATSPYDAIERFTAYDRMAYPKLVIGQVRAIS